MIDLYSISRDELSQTVRHMRDFAKKRGYPKFLKLYDKKGPNYLLLTRPDGKTLRLYGSIPPTTSKIAASIADNKWLSYQLLNGLGGVKQPATLLVEDGDENFVEDFLKKYRSVVVKPIDGAHGNGVSVGIKDESVLNRAILHAKKYCHDKKGIILQEQLPFGLPELRIICINFQYTTAMVRVPATVTGDGERNLEQLIDYENTFLRAAPYSSDDDNAFIDKDAALEFLGERATSFIPAKGEKVRVLSVCNVGKGGTMEDVTDEISSEQIRLSERIAKYLDLPVIGIDFYGDYVIEVNASPSLYQSVKTPNATICVEKYLDYLESIKISESGCINCV